MVNTKKRSFWDHNGAHAEKAKRLLPVMALGGVFCLMLTCNILTPYLVDDFAYMKSFATGERLNDFGDLIPSLAAHAETMNGRLFSHFFVQLFMLMPKWVFNVVNTTVFVSEILLMSCLCSGKKNVSFWLPGASFCVLWLFQPAFGQVNLWMDGSCNYLWTSVFLL